MAQFRVSGIWKNDDEIITHYAFHKVVSSTHLSRAEKISKAEAIKITETVGNTVTTWLWNYSAAEWKIGENVHVVNGINGKYLRSNRDNTLTDNLDHLINFDWLRL